jgi:sulfite reductase alpha subunit-like flavoprotein
MATGVEEALVEIVGDDRVQALIAEGRYRRDVY